MTTEEQVGRGCQLCETFHMKDCSYNGVPVCLVHFTELNSRYKVKHGLPLNEVEAQYDDAKSRENCE